MSDLTGKIAIVTGGGGGLGSGISAILTERGATVAVADLSIEAASSVVSALAAEGREAKSFGVDITQTASAKRLIDDVLVAYGRLDILVNNAGIHGAPGFEDAEGDFREEDWDTTFDVNVKGTLHMLEAVLGHMVERRSGKIVNISSHSGRGELPAGGGIPSAPSGGAYGASKAAVIYLTQTYAVRLGPYNINVNCVCPGSIFTPLWAGYARWAAKHVPDFAGLTPEQVYDRAIRMRTPLGRPQTPEDVGRAVAFFVSEDAKNITGQALNVNGGQRMN